MFPAEIARLAAALDQANQADAIERDIGEAAVFEAAEAVVEAFQHPPAAYEYGDATDLQKAVWSHVSRSRGVDQIVQYTWREWAEELEKQARRLAAFATIVADLGRSPNGRHEGDAEGEDPTGVSQGNPFIQEGQVFGYTLGGDCYVMPPRGSRSDPNAWVVPRTEVAEQRDGAGTIIAAFVIGGDDE